MRTPAPVLALGLLGQGHGEQVVRTGDIGVRGLTPADFPRVHRLATNVYTFEQVDPAKRTVTVNNLIVAGEDGVLVAEGQGTEANVRKLIDTVRTITAAPVRYVVVGSEHGDHTWRDAAFGSGATMAGRALRTTRSRR